MKWVYIANVVIFMVSAAAAGAAPNHPVAIVGRVVMGVGGAVVYQSNLIFVAGFGTSDETPRLFGLLSAIWPWVSSLAALSGVRSRLEQTHHLAVGFLHEPTLGGSQSCGRHYLPSSQIPRARLSVGVRLMAIDSIGVAFNMAAPVLFALALEFSGPVWKWGFWGVYIAA
ncbi:unnamed protein product [Penicillium nalgiovense]|nr:unnamed protein product [Penicillium nalgiovense]